MRLLLGILLIMGGLLAAGPWIATRRPDAAKAIATLAKGQALIGVLLILFGSAILIFHLLPRFAVATFVEVLADGVILVLGFFLGFGWIRSRFMQEREDLATAGQKWVLRVGHIQVPLGLAAVGLGMQILIL